MMIEDNILLAVVFVITTFAGIETRTSGAGPVFILQPPSLVEFFHAQGTVVDCVVHGDPVPEVSWVISDNIGNALKPVPQLLAILPNNSLVLESFDSSSYRQDIHSTIYRCKATNKYGTIISKPVNVKGVVDQEYRTQVYDEYVILGNTAVLRCNVPSYISDYVKVISWIVNDNKRIQTASQKEIGNRYVILDNGNLHIGEVNRKDAEASYKCETIHRVTKKTKISDKAGRLYVTEPTSSISPKIVDYSNRIIGDLGEWSVLSCAAQGYPSPTYSWCKVIKGTCKAIKSNLKTIRQDSGNMYMELRAQDTGTYVCNVENNVGKDQQTISVIALARMTVFVNPQTQVVEFGQRVSLECVITADRGLDNFLTVEWFKNGEKLKSDKNLVVNKKLVQILSADNDSRGMYQCFVHTPDDVTQATAEIRLDSIKPTFLETFKTKLTQPHTSLTLKCSAIGDPVPIITWTFADQSLSSDENIKISDKIDDKGVSISEVFITSVKSTDGGIYSCIASNKAGITLHSAKIDVYGLPFVRPIINKTVVMGDEFTLHCHVSGYPIETMYWIKGEDHVHSSAHVQQYKNGTMKLVATKESGGRYTCKAEHKGSVSVGHGWVKVLVQPKLYPWNKVTPTETGSMLILMCAVKSGDRPIDFRWTKDQKSISHLLGITISRSSDMSTLKVSKVNSIYSGNYSCEAKNEAGSTTIWTEVQVQGSPQWNTEPQSVTITNRKDVRLHCEGKGYPRPKSQWNTIDGHSLLNTTTATVYRNGTLIIHGQTFKTKQKYTCVVSNGIKPDLMKLITVSFLSGPAFGPTVNNIITQKGKSSVLKCTVRTDGKPKIYWMKGSKIISTRTHRMNVQEMPKANEIDSILTIYTSMFQDTGQYVCVVENDGNRLRKVFTLNVFNPRDANGSQQTVMKKFEHSNVAAGPGKKNLDIYVDGNYTEGESDGENHELLGVTILYIIPTTTAAVVLFIVLVIVCILLKRQTKRNSLPGAPVTTDEKGYNSLDKPKYYESSTLKSGGTLGKQDGSNLSHRYYQIQRLHRSGSEDIYTAPHDGSEIQPYATFTTDNGKEDSKRPSIQLRSFN